MIYEAQQFIYLPGHSRNTQGKALRLYSASADMQFGRAQVPSKIRLFLGLAHIKRQETASEYPEAYGRPFAELKVWPDEWTDEDSPEEWHRFFLYPTAWDVRTEDVE